MKKLYLIGGTMGVGKTAVSQALKKLLPSCVFLDGDWCWDAHPFLVTEETKQMVLDNIRFLLNRFLSCSAYENVVFCWVMHEGSIIESILSGVKTDGVTVITVSLIADEAHLTERISRDVAAGLRTPDVLPRSLSRIPLYEKLNTVKIDTSGKTVNEIAREIAEI